MDYKKLVEAIIELIKETEENLKRQKAIEKEFSQTINTDISKTYKALAYQNIKEAIKIAYNKKGSQDIANK